MTAVGTEGCRKGGGFSDALFQAEIMTSKALNVTCVKEGGHGDVLGG